MSVEQCGDCRAASLEGARRLGLPYRTQCGRCRAESVQRYQRVRPASSKADNDYGKAG